MRTLHVPFRSSSDFIKCRWLGANGEFASGASLPDGIANRIYVEDSVCKLYVDTAADAPDASGWKRSEIDFGEFPAAFGEFWTVFDFKYDWTFSEYVVIGSWAVMINGSSGTTYVPLGFRIKNHCLLIQSPADSWAISFSNQELASVPITPGKWYRVCAHVNLKSDATGFREVFLDGVPIVRQYNVQTTYSTATAHYFKLGPYDGDHLQAFPYASMSLRNVSMWSGNDGYQTVMGCVPRTVARLLSN